MTSTPPRLSAEVESLLAAQAIYQVHLHLLLRNAQVQQAIGQYEASRRKANGGDEDILALLTQINRAQSALVQACKAALSAYPALQAKLNDSRLQLVLVDALCAFVH